MSVTTAPSLGLGPHLRGQLLRPGRDVGGRRAGQAGAVGRRPGLGVDRQVLHRLEPHRHAGDVARAAGRRRSRTSRQAAVAVALGLEVDQQPPAVLRRVDPVDAEIRARLVDRRDRGRARRRPRSAASRRGRRRPTAPCGRPPGPARYPAPGTAPWGWRRTASPAARPSRRRRSASARYGRAPTSAPCRSAR